ncbi:MAG: PAS domain-containing sensor histidine kinase [Actinobacteria bacterium]|nr:PAS domain-containing sensor histidine kinase [Actinomycetota bacterium]
MRKGSCKGKGKKDAETRAAVGCHPDRGWGCEAPSAPHSEDFYRLLVENTLDLIAVLDAEGRITYSSPSITPLLGYEQDELLGRIGFDFVHPEDQERIHEIFTRGIESGEPTKPAFYRFLHKDGSWRHFESVGIGMFDNPSVRGMVITSREITDRLRAEAELKESEEMYRTLVLTSPDAVTISDLQGRLIYVSPYALKMNGYEDEDEVLGKNAFIFIHPRDHDKAIEAWKRVISEGTVHNVELTGIRRDGSDFAAELNAALIRDAAGEPKRLVAFIRDISARKRMEKELQQRNEELEAFAHTISHDLLTPVAIVEGYAKAALEADAEGRAEAERECLEAIARGAQRMSDLINSLLQYAQAGHTMLEECRADAEEVLMEVLMDLEEHRRERRVRVESGDHLPAVRVDGVKLRQVLFNLIGNAIRHMGECDDPCVRVSAETQGDKAVFCVQDNGIGVPLDLQEKIFEPFRHYSVSGSPGLGIGLSTVKRAVTAWGGRVWVESRPGEGAAFFFTAPLA